MVTTNADRLEETPRSQAAASGCPTSTPPAVSRPSRRRPARREGTAAAAPAAAVVGGRLPCCSVLSTPSCCRVSPSPSSSPSSHCGLASPARSARRSRPPALCARRCASARSASQQPLVPRKSQHRMTSSASRTNWHDWTDSAGARGPAAAGGGNSPNGLEHGRRSRLWGGRQDTLETGRGRGEERVIAKVASGNVRWDGVVAGGTGCSGCGTGRAAGLAHASWLNVCVPRLSERWPLWIELSGLAYAWRRRGVATPLACRSGAAMAGSGAQWRALSTVADDDDDDEIDIANWRPPVSEPPAAATLDVDKADAIAIDESNLPANGDANGLDEDGAKVRSAAEFVPRPSDAKVRADLPCGSGVSSAGAAAAVVASSGRCRVGHGEEPVVYSVPRPRHLPGLPDARHWQGGRVHPERVHRHLRLRRPHLLAHGPVRQGGRPQTRLHRVEAAALYAAPALRPTEPAKPNGRPSLCSRGSG